MLLGRLRRQVPVVSQLAGEPVARDERGHRQVVEQLVQHGGVVAVARGSDLVDAGAEPAADVGAHELLEGRAPAGRPR